MPLVEVKKEKMKKLRSKALSRRSLERKCEQVHTGVGLRRISPNSGSIFYTPIVDVSLKPVVGMVFDSLEPAIDFYKKYAAASGFTVRKSTDYKRNDTVKLKYLCCSKQGLRGGRVFNTLSVADKRSNKRSRPSIRCGCNAAVKIGLADDNKYKIYFVHEEHNHSLVNEEDAQFLPANRKVDHVKENMVQALSLINVGPVKAFNILRALYGGYGNVGATKNDFKNLKRDLNVYIGQFDSDMVVQRLMKKKEFLPNFSVEYTTKEDGSLNGLFWADDISKKNYYTFGDVVSFDATYRSNKYNLIFVPFTGIDNHNRNVNFGAALLGSETFESYKWLLQCFLKAFGHAPQVVVTDQDPAMKKAIEDVLPDTRHRLCMWHIWDKLSDKVGAVVCNNIKFKERMTDIVWTDSLSPDEFEKEWDSVVNEFGLETHSWLKKIFSLREDWIPAYYREENLSGLMRTTSRSESKNHFFGKYYNSRGTLVEFLNHFDTAMEAQRYENRKKDHETRYTQPDIWSTFVLER